MGQTYCRLRGGGVAATEKESSKQHATTAQRRRLNRASGHSVEPKIASIVSEKRSSTAAHAHPSERTFVIMILKLLVPLAAVSVAYAIPASLRGARTSRALTEETLKIDETPEDDEAPEAAAGPEGAAIAGMDAATQRDVVDGILRDPYSARDVIASALGLEPSAVDRLLGAEEASPCAGLLAFCDKYELTGPFCDFASDCGGIEDISEFFDQAEEASRDDAEIGLPPFPVDPDLGIEINLPGGISFAAGVNLELGEGSGPGLSITGGVVGDVKAEVDPAQNPLGFGIGGQLTAGADGETGIDGELDMGGVDLDFDTEGSSAVGMQGNVGIGDSATFGVSSARMDGEAGFQAAANPMGANVVAGADGFALAGTFGNTVVMGTSVIRGSAAVEVSGASESNSTLVIGPTVSANVGVQATGEVRVNAVDVTLMGQSQTLDASVGGAVQSNIKKAVSPAGVSAAGDLDVVGILKLDASGDLITGSTVINVPIVDVGFDVTIP